MSVANKCGFLAMAHWHMIGCRCIPAGGRLIVIAEELTWSSEIYLLPRYRGIVALDMADFTNPARTELHRVTMHNGLYEIARTAFDEAGIDWNRCEPEDRG